MALHRFCRARRSRTARTYIAPQVFGDWFSAWDILETLAKQRRNMADYRI